ncbi:MAG: endonuclease/exonuclease/phosphatase family protein [Anaerolineae bacterium]|nr:endonuclease/exonuclease/phosphatase family protein [Anaerolineae bacterium]
METIRNNSISVPLSFPVRLKRMGIAASVLLIGGHVIVVWGYWLLSLLGSRTMLYTVLSYVAPWLFLPLLVLLPVALLRRSRWMIVGEVACLALFVMLYGAWFLPRHPTTAPQTTFKVMTHNIFWANVHLDQIAAEIKTASPDIVGLQELSPESWATLEPDLAGLYPYRYISADCGIFSRYPLEACEDIIVREDFPHRSQKCEVNLDGRRITFFNVHPRSPYLDAFTIGPFVMPGAFKINYHEDDVQGVLDQLRRVQNPMLLVGDLNFSPQHQLYRDFTATLRDSYRERGWGLGFTYSCRKCAQVPVWRLDYLFHSAEIAAVDIQIGDYHGSDHRAVIATFGFSAK